MSKRGDSYQYYKRVFQGVPMPFAFVDLDRFDANIRGVLARAGDKPIRVASKSIRCLTLLRRIQAAEPLDALQQFIDDAAHQLLHLGVAPAVHPHRPPEPGFEGHERKMSRNAIGLIHAQRKA